jgi:hypothetical protein
MLDNRRQRGVRTRLGVVDYSGELIEPQNQSLIAKTIDLDEPMP